MMVKITPIILILLNLLYSCIASEENAKLKVCKTDSLSAQCPPNTSCTSLPQQNTAGFCKCFDKFNFNPNFTKDEEYCVAATPTTTVSTTIVTSTTPKSTSTISTTTLSTSTIKVKPPTIKTTTIKSIVTSPTTTSSTTTKGAPTPPIVFPTNSINMDDGVQKKKVPVEAEHLLGGIMLPFMIVVLFIGGVYFIRKHHLLERAHNYLTERNWRLPGTARPNYNDFDEFDDPLLI